MSRICVVVLFVILKGVFHELFDLQCFHDSNPSGPLINRLKDYLIRILFADIFDHLVRQIRLRGVHHIAELAFESYIKKCFLNVFFGDIFAWLLGA